MNPLISVDWLFKQLNNPNLVILDVSLKTNVAKIKIKYPNTQIKGARYFDLKGKFSDVNNPLPNTLPSPKTFQNECRKLGINNDSLVVAYDNIGVYASPRVWWMFKIMGHKNILVLNGGLPLWLKNNYPIEPLQQHPLAIGDFLVKYNPKLQKSASQILENILKKESVVVDARSRIRFNGQIPETRKNLKSGHIPDSVNLPFLEVLDRGKFLPNEKIKAIFSKLNLLNKPIIYTCGSGLTACILILAAEIISEKTNYLYDGSWAEWGGLKGVPIHTLIEKD